MNEIDNNLQPLVELAQLLFKGPYSLSQPIEGLQPIDGPTGVIYCLPYPKYEA